jgi:hypothetical protein
VNKLLLLAVLLAGCGGTAAPTAVPATSPTTTAAVTAAPTAVPATPEPTEAARVDAACAELMTPLVDALHDLSGRLNVGLDVRDYGERLGSIRVEYEKAANRLDRVDSQCLELVGRKAESAMNDYIEAYEQWRKCLSDTSCQMNATRPHLQVIWARAAKVIGEIDRSMP